MDADTLERFEYDLAGYIGKDFHRIVCFVNRTGRMDELLELLGADTIAERYTSGYSGKGKVLVIGESFHSEEELRSVTDALGFEPDRFEFCIGYKEISRYQFTKLKNGYCLILAGPIAHKVRGIDCSGGGVLSTLEDDPEYPPVVRLGQNGLKITKTDLERKLRDLIRKGELCP